MSLDFADSLFGIPLALRRNDAQQLAAALDAKWESQTGGRTGDLEADLESLARVIRPTARGATLRAMASGLRETPSATSRYLKPPLVVGTGEAQALAPEGRIALEVLREALRGPGEVVVIEPDAVFAAEHRAYILYRDLSTARLLEVLRTGQGRVSLRLPAVAAVLVLLVNGSTSLETAIVRPPDEFDRERLDDALSAMGLAFCRALDSERINPAAFSLYSGYAWTEAGRHFSHCMAANPWFLRPGMTDELLGGLVGELSRRHRYVSADNALRALDALVAAYKEHQPVLAGLGLSHYRNADVRRLRAHLEGLLGQRPKHP